MQRQEALGGDRRVDVAPARVVGEGLHDLALAAKLAVGVEAVNLLELELGGAVVAVVHQHKSFVVELVGGAVVKFQLGHAVAARGHAND